VIWYGRKDAERLTQDKKIQISSWLLSDFNLENAALVSAIAQNVGIKQEVVDGVFREFKGVPGRLEFVTHPNKPLAVIDYAHTPESLRAVYVFLKTKGERLIGVIGSAGGGRDKWKRPQMADNWNSARHRRDCTCTLFS
jgi:UDP-N-acetylmuramoyl-L-alanyl-D-glutamate--2,6-diaminopimelate ligase